MSPQLYNLYGLNEDEIREVKMSSRKGFNACEDEGDIYLET